MPKRTGHVILAVILYLIIAAIIRLFIPDIQVIEQFLEHTYKTYGYGFVYIFALLEGIFIVGMFTSGTAIVMFGAALSAKGVLFLPFVILSAAAGLLSGSVISYWAGRLGWQKLIPRIKGAQELITKAQSMHATISWLTFVSFASTGIGSAIATLAGTLRVNFRKFLLFAAAAHLVWVSIWSAIAYLFGVYAGNTFIAFGGVLVVIMVISLGIQWYVRKKQTD